MLFRKLEFQNPQAKHIPQEVTTPGMVEWGLGKEVILVGGGDTMSAAQ